MKYNFFLEADEEEEESMDLDLESESDEEGTENDYLGGDEESSDDSGSESEESSDEEGTDNDYLGGDEESSDDSGSESYGMAEDDNSGVYNSIAKCAYACSVASNNIQGIHFNVKGKCFDVIHRLSDEYYHTLRYTVDQLVELALEDKNTNIDNMCNASKYVPEISIENEESYNYESACTAIQSNLKLLLNIFTSARSMVESHHHIQSILDEKIAYLSRQANYLMERRQATNESFNFSIR